ncbi:unnamed protein product [Boreogadus saida]
MKMCFTVFVCTKVPTHAVHTAPRTSRLISSVPDDDGIVNRMRKRMSTLGYIALLIATFHGLLFGWKRAFEEDAYRFYLPPNFVVALALLVCVVLGKVLLLLPCVAAKLHCIRRGGESGRAARSLWTQPPSAGPSALQVSPERVSIM